MFLKTEVGVSQTVGKRLQPTLDVAIIEKNKYTAKAKWTGLVLNIAIGLQVLLGSLTTGLSAQAVSGAKSVNKYLLFFKHDPLFNDCKRLQRRLQLLARLHFFVESEFS